MDSTRPPARYLRRLVDDELDELFLHLPAILLDGPKGVGKTETAQRRCRSVRRLDVGSERAVVVADPYIVRGDPAPVLIDEWQRVPEVFDVVRRLVDEDPSGGRFLLTGSAPTGATHSGAARIATLRMRPLALSERLGLTSGVSLGDLLSGGGEIGGRSDLSLADYVHEIVAGGFPGMRQLSGRALTVQLDGYLERIVDHDLPEVGFRVRRPAAITGWLRAYAAAVATTTTWEKIRDAAMANSGAGLSKTSTRPYIELLNALRILDPLPAWHPTRNHLSALVGAPKHHLADPALAARLVRLSASRLLEGATPESPIPSDASYLGALFESLAALSVRAMAQRHGARVYHLRTQGGRHEVDMIVEGAHGVVGIEVKLAGTVDDRDVTHLHWLRQRLADECRDLVVITTGREAYRRRDGVAVVPLGVLTP
jgi:predicted AAA+ superfamily ATPase